MSYNFENIEKKLDEMKSNHASYQEAMDKIPALEEKINAFDQTSSASKDEVEKIVNDYENLKESVDKMHAENQRNSVVTEMDKERDKLSKAFANMLRHPKNQRYASEYQDVLEGLNVMQVKSDPDGGYTVPETMASGIIQTSEGNNPMRSLSQVQTTSGDSFTFLADPDELGVENNDEGSSADDTSTPTIFQTKVYVKKIDAEPKVTPELVEDSSWDIVGYLTQKAGRIMRKRENRGFTIGNGSDEAKGFATYTAVANATFESALTTYWGNSLGYIASGDASSIVTADGLIGLTDAIQDDYQANAVFQMRRATATVIKQIKATISTASDNEYSLWMPSFVPGQPDTLMGYPLIKNDNMPAIAADALAVAFGDFQEGYGIVDKVGMYMLVNPYRSNSFIRYYFAKRTGGDVVNFEAIKLLKIEA